MKKIKLLNISIECFLIPLITTVFLFIGVLILYNWNGITLKISIKPLVSFIYFFIFAILQKNSNQNVIGSLEKRLIIICCFCSLACVFNQDTDLFISAICVLLAVVFAARIDLNPKTTVYNNITLSMIIVCLLSICIFTVKAVNSQGLLYSLTGIVVMNYIILRKKHTIKLFLIVFLIFVTLISATKSRTSLIAFITVSFFSYFFLFLRKPKKSYFIFLISLLMILPFFTDRIASLANMYFGNKWSGNEDLTSGRTEIWIRTISEARIFGNGLNFLNWFSSTGLPFDAHNAFLQFLGCYGIVCFILIILFAFGVIKRIVKSSNKIIYLNFFTGWLIFAMFENVDIFTSRMIPCNMLFLLHVILLSHDSFESNNNCNTTRILDNNDLK